MENVDELLSKKRKFENLKSNINVIIAKLNSAIENLAVPSNEINKLYNIDGMSVDEGKINEVRNNLINKRNYLRNNVLYSINIELKKISESINGA